MLTRPMLVLLILPLVNHAATLERVSICGPGNLLVPSRETEALGAAPDYQWWYGCSPTAAGMLMGYYDINGYGGETYSNLVPGAVAESSTFPSTEGSWEYKVQHIIASQRHVRDFYGGGYLASGDDMPDAPSGPLDSLADFMGTNQDAYGNVNGATFFFFFTDGSRLTVADLYNHGVYEEAGAYGIYEFLRWAGYGDANSQVVDYIYNQYVDSLGLVYGFSLADYIAEINAGRVVLLHIVGHSMLGYGYDSMTGELLIHDTSTPGEHRMYWGSTYYGYILFGVTVVDLSGIPGDDPCAGFVACFLDVPESHWAASFIGTIAENGITSGCDATHYCPDDSVTRAQMAVFLERGMRGSDYDPGAGVGNIFLDVPASYWAAGWIELLYMDGITSGCGDYMYCPGNSTTRAEMAVFLLRAKYGMDYAPPTPIGVFNDVPLTHWAAGWIEQLAAEGITSGCGGGNYCPADPVNRDQMAVFLVRTFQLQ